MRTTSEGLRAHKRDRTRQALIDAARELFGEVGYDGTRTAEIARRAEVSEATLFRYFPSKADLALAGLARELARAVAAFAARPSDESPTEALEAAMVDVSDHWLAASDDGLREVELLLRHRELQSRLFGLIHEARAGLTPSLADRMGRDRDDVVVELAARSVLGAVLAALRRWADSGGTVDPFATFRTCLPHLASFVDAEAT